MWFKMHPWVFPIVFFAIGVLYIFINIGAAAETKKIQTAGSDHHVSGVPILGGIHFLIGGLISPIKWLALLFFLDYTIWMFFYVVFFYEPLKKKAEEEEKKEEHIEGKEE